MSEYIYNWSVASQDLAHKIFPIKTQPDETSLISWCRHVKQSTTTSNANTHPPPWLKTKSFHWTKFQLKMQLCALMGMCYPIHRRCACPISNPGNSYKFDSSSKGASLHLKQTIKQTSEYITGQDFKQKCSFVHWWACVTPYIEGVRVPLLSNQTVDLWHESP